MSLSLVLHFRINEVLSRYQEERRTHLAYLENLPRTEDIDVVKVVNREIDVYSAAIIKRAGDVAQGRARDLTESTPTSLVRLLETNLQQSLPVFLPVEKDSPGENAAVDFLRERLGLMEEIPAKNRHYIDEFESHLEG